MGENQFKPGDKIITREVLGYRPRCGAGKTLTVKGATDYACRWGVLYTFVEVTHGVYSSGMELVERMTLDEQLTAAKAEVTRIEGLIAERDAPKVGDRYTDGKTVWEIVAVNLVTRQSAWVFVSSVYPTEKQEGWASFETWSHHKKL